MFVHVRITKDILDRAIKREKEAGAPYKGATIEGGKGRFYGFLGEEVALAAIPGAIQDNSKDHDFKIGGVTFDVKTKTRKDTPKDWYDGTVDQSANHQRPNYYVFVHIVAPQNLNKLPYEQILNFEYKDAWITGYISREKFYSPGYAKYFRSGEIDPSNGLKYRENCYVLSYKRMNDPQKLIHVAKKRAA